MFKHFINLRNTLASVKLHGSSIIAAEQLDEFTKQLNDRASSNKPVVMVYGVYSAGKSTLINALAGKELAAVDKLPTTSKVHSYIVDDVEILDTPGIDAPQDHEQISREQLHRSDAVIFVLNSRTTLEEKQTYEEIGNILAAKKPLIVVMNNSSDLQQDSHNYQAILNQFRINLYNHLTDNEELLARLDQVPHFLVNAQSALKGKLERKQKLLEHSQMPALEQAITRLFSQTGSAEIAQNLEHQLYVLLDEAITNAQANNHNTSTELQQLSQLINSLQASQISLLNKIVARAESNKPLLKSQITELLQAGNSQAITDIAQEWQTEINSYYQEQVERECQQLSTEAVQTTELILQHRVLEANNTDQATTDNNSALIDTLQSAFKVSGLQFKFTEEAAKKGIFTILQQSKSLFPQMFKGIGVKTMGKMATKYAPLVGTLVEIGTSSYDYYQAQQYEQAQINAERQHQEHLRNQAHTWVDNLVDNLKDALEQSLSETFDPISKELQNKLGMLSASENSTQGTINKLQELQMRLCNG